MKRITNHNQVKELEKRERDANARALRVEQAAERLRSSLSQMSTCASTPMVCTVRSAALE